MPLPDLQLARINHYSIHLVHKNSNYYTYSIQIKDLINHSIIVDLPLDPMDNTLAAILPKEALTKLGNDAPIVLEKLSQMLQEQIGAKEFIMIPKNAELPGYVAIEEATFKRVRHAAREEVNHNATLALQPYQELVTELDKTLKLVVGTKKLHQAFPSNAYETLYQFVKEHANFTPEKMMEYEKEGVQGLKSRFSNNHVIPLVLINSQKQICATMRSLKMGEKYAYFSDEMINQDLISHTKFPGRTEEEQRKNRGIFLLAYLTQKTSSLSKDIDHFILIAAEGRENLYSALGFQTFPIQSNDYKVVMKLSKPGPALTKIKEELIQPLSAESSHTLFLKKDGTIWMAGNPSLFSETRKAAAKKTDQYPEADVKEREMLKSDFGRECTKRMK